MTADAPPLRRALLWLGLSLLVVTPFNLDRLDNEFVWDDRPLIVESDFIHDPGNLPSLFLHDAMYSVMGEEYEQSRAMDTYRPVTMATFVWDAALSGRDPLAYHVTNLLGHLCCVVLVFALAWRVLPASYRGLAVVAAVWFGLHPVTAEAHVWINGRSDVFVTLFGLAALMTWLAALERRGGAGAALHVAAAALFLLGCLSKEVLLLALPAMALLCLSPFAEAVGGEAAGKRPWSARMLALLGPVLAAAAYLGVRSAVFSGLKTHGDGGQLMAAIVHVPLLWLDGLFNLLVPYRPVIRLLGEEYGRLGSPVLAMAALGALLLGAAVVAVRRRAPLFPWSLVWFAAILAPAALISTQSSWWGFGRYLYLPLAGLAVGGVCGLAQLLQMPVLRHGSVARYVVLAAIGFYLVALSLQFQREVRDWHDIETLSQSIIEQNPRSSLGYLGLGTMYTEQGRPDEGVPWLRQAVEINPDQPRAVYNLGVALLDLGLPAEALPWLERATALSPYHEGALYNGGLAQLDTGQPEAALTTAHQGQARFPDRAAFFHLEALVWAGVEAARSASFTLEALLREPDHDPSRAIIGSILRTHPQAEAWRERVETLLADPRYAPIAEQVREDMAAAL